MIVSISLTREYDQPQLIFESLNSTGLDLTQTDLIRNYILIDLDQRQQEKIYNDYWYPMEQIFQAETDQFDRFIRDYLTLRTESIPRIEDIYDDFKSFTEDYISKTNHRTSKYVSIKNLFIDIYTSSKYYAKIAFSREIDKEIQDSFNNINRLKVKVAYPFLLQVYCDYDNNIISKETFLEILKIIESYVFRRAICEVPTNSLNKTFVLLIKAIDKNNYLESIKATLILYKKYRIFPTDIEFKKNLMIKDVYGFRNNRFLLDNLELYGQKEKALLEECSIEHIMPQNENLPKEWQQELGPNWRNIHENSKHIIGNLTLTGYNTELGDKPFKEKRDMVGGYRDSIFRLSKDLIDLEHWNEEEIIKRTEKLSDLAVNIWSYPKVNPEILDKYKNESTDVEETNYLTIIRDELKKTLLDEWKFHTMKWRVLIFKKTWLNDFREFYSPNYPFIHYTIDSWINDNGFELSVCFNLDESKNYGGKFDLRKKFTDILDEEINKTELTYRYLKNQKNTKLKEVLIEDDNFHDEELKDVADAMLELINTSVKPIQSTIKRFKDTYKDEIEIWKKR